MVNIGVLAADIIKTIEEEDAFDKAKAKGGFKKYFKAKNIGEVLHENWSNE